ncbi:MAG TPA: enoyl-CoA hydratase/isomerase family protein [Pseudomonadales bacterium]|nr:enoyl-CoA hydratase/isomerase family protein [Pseudomonadales bacterium]
MDLPVMTLQSVRDCMFNPNPADADPDAVLLLIDLAGFDSIHAGERHAIADWLLGQPLPVIGIGIEPSPDTELSEAADLLVADESEAVAIVRAVRRNPAASGILIQVLRSVPDLPIPQALAIESLGYATLQGGSEFTRWLETRPTKSQHKDIGERPVLMSRKEGHLDITLNSPSNRNALSAPMRDALSEAFKLVDMDASITSVDVRGNGPSFSAGGDLTEFGTSRDLAEAHRIRSLRMPAQYLARCASRCTFHLHGACIGAGIELPAFAGKLIAHPDTVLRLPEVGMGLIPGAGGCVSITRRIGRQKTAYMAITGKDVSAREALAWGLVDAIAG